MGRKRPRTVSVPVRTVTDDVLLHTQTTNDASSSHTRHDLPEHPQDEGTNQAFSSSMQLDSSDEDFVIDMTLEHGNMEENSATATTKSRGPTLMAHIWNLPKSKRIVVEWNKLWQPVGGERSTLAHFLGTMARNPSLCSLSYTDWRLVPKENKEQLLKIVKSKFIIPNIYAATYVIHSMGRKWSNFKAELKNDHYEPNRGNVSKILNAKPDTVPKDQWISLVTYWTSTKGKERSQLNRKSRGSQVMAHTAGSKSFACVIAEQTIDGVPPSRAHVFLETHKDRKTQCMPMDEKSKQAVDMINEKLSTMPNNKEVTHGTVAWDGDIYSQVMKEVVGPERKGRVRGLGRGPKSLTSISCRDNEEQVYDDEHDPRDEKIKFLESELKKVNDKYAKMEEDYSAAQRKTLEEISMLKVALFGRDILGHGTQPPLSI